MVPDSRKRIKAYLLLTTVSLLWGIASPVIKYTLNFIPPYSFLFWRFLLTSLIFLPIFLFFLKKNPIKAKDWPWLIFLGFLSTPLNLILLFVGYEKTTSMDGVLISATAPVFIAIGGALFLKEKVTKIERIGLVIAVIGSLITISQPIFEGNLFKGSLIGNFLVFISVLAWVVYTLFAKKKAFKYHPVIPTAIGFFVGLITIIPFFVLENRSLTYNFSLLTFNLNALLGILYMVLFSSVVAYTLYLYGVDLIEASEAALFAYLQPIFAAPFALWWLGEKITLTFFLGALLISLGVVISEARKETKKKQ